MLRITIITEAVWPCVEQTLDHLAASRMGGKREVIAWGRRETLANLSITGHLRCFSDQPVAEIVQCGEPLSSSDPIREHVERLDVGRRKTSAIELRVRYDC